MLTRQDIEEQVKQFIQQQLLIKRVRLGLDTQIGDDLGVDGDDGVDFMSAFAERFAVDICALEIGLHFGPEAGGNPIALLWYLLFPSSRPRFVTITVKDLMEAAEKGVWQTPNRVPV